MAWPADESSRRPLRCLKSDALFSACGRYRWLLKRPIAMPVDDEPLRVLLFVGLNPSLADAGRDDPTLRRLKGFARDWGHHQLVVLNLFARISPSPVALRRCSDPVGSVTDSVMTRWFTRWSRSSCWDLWLGWGSAGTVFNRDQQVVTMLEKAMLLRGGGAPPQVIGTTRNGQPRHPLYVSAGRTLSPWACTVR